MPSEQQKPKVVLLSLNVLGIDILEVTEDIVPMLQALKAKAEVSIIKTAAAADELFLGKERPVVFAFDDGLTQDGLVQQKAEAAFHVNSGGTIIFSGLLRFAGPLIDDKLFKAFGLPWDYGTGCSGKYEINPFRGAHVEAPKLELAYVEAIELENVRLEDALYLPKHTRNIKAGVSASSGPTVQTFAAIAKCGEGRVGFVGGSDCDGDSVNAVLAMCGLGD